MFAIALQPYSILSAEKWVDMAKSSKRNGKHALLVKSSAFYNISLTRAPQIQNTEYTCTCTLSRLVSFTISI